MRFEGKSALVTGAASGIGRATALRLISEGAMVGCLDLDEAGLQSLLQESAHFQGAESTGKKKLLVAKGSIASAQEVESFVALAKAEFGRVDFLFNNAGIEFVSPLDETSEADWDAVYDVNVKGTYLMSKSVIPHLREVGGGVIVNNASDAGLRGIRMNAAYSSSKAAIIHMTRSLALDYGKENIRTNCICPGCIKTPLCERFNAEVGAAQGISGEQALQEFVDANIPMLRVGMPDEVASVVAFLFSDEAKYISGAIIPIDGGLTAGM